MIKYADLAVELGIRGTITGQEYHANCPFHDDRNPSWAMNIDSGLWICYRGCGQGDFAHLVMQILGATYQDAVFWMRQRERKPSVEALQSSLSAEMALETAIGSYNHSDKSWREHFYSLTNDVMPNWFLERGFDWDTILHWGIRYDPLDAVVIPVIWNEELVGTVTRYAKGEPKYRNSPGLNKPLFGQIFPSQNLIILVEGPLDAIWCWKAGISAYSLLGDRMSEYQLELLRAKHGRTREVALGFDADAAGRNATAVIAEQLMRSGTWLLPQITQLTWPQGTKDAQDCSVEQLRQVVTERKDVANGIFTTRG